MIFLFFDNFVAYLYVNHSLFPEKEDYDMKDKNGYGKAGKQRKKKGK